MNQPMDYSTNKTGIKTGPSIQHKNRTVLIVEDDEFIFNLLEMMLKDTGVNVLYAANGDQALQIVTENHVDLVFMDIRLPGESGYDIFERIRSVKSHVPVVAQTANLQPGEKRKFLAAGFADYLVKPVDSSTLQRLLDKLIGSSN